MVGRKEQIRKAAQILFRERGYTATSMRELANEVDIEAASIYNHYKSKQAILQTICFDIAQQFFAAFNEVEKLPLPADQKLTKAITVHINVIAQNLDAAGVFLHEWRFLEGEHLQKFKTMRSQYERGFQRIIVAGIREGVFKITNVRLYCLSMFSAMNWIYQWYHPDGDLAPSELGIQFSEMLLNGLSVK